MRLAVHYDGVNSSQNSGHGFKNHSKTKIRLKEKELKVGVHCFFGVRRSVFGPNAISDQENRQRQPNMVIFILSDAIIELYEGHIFKIYCSG
jgi:hypothetical protein